MRGNGGRWSERKEAGRGERMRLGDVWGKERKKERILRLWRGKKANKSIVYKLVVFLQKNRKDCLMCVKIMNILKLMNMH